MQPRLGAPFGGAIVTRNYNVSGAIWGKEKLSKVGILRTCFDGCSHCFNVCLGDNNAQQILRQALSSPEPKKSKHVNLNVVIASPI